MRNYSIDEDRWTAINILVNHWHNRRKHLNKELKNQDALATGKQLFSIEKLVPNVGFMWQTQRYITVTVPT